MNLLWEWIDYWIKHKTNLESDVTSAWFCKLRKLFWTTAWIWKIPDIGSKLKPCDWIMIFEWWIVYIIEIKILKQKTWVYNKDSFQKEFVSLMEPLQVSTFHSLTKLWIPCIMSLFNPYTHTFYNIIYKEWQMKPNQ